MRCTASGTSRTPRFVCCNTSSSSSSSSFFFLSTAAAAAATPYNRRYYKNSTQLSLHTNQKRIASNFGLFPFLFKFAVCFSNFVIVVCLFVCFSPCLWVCGEFILGLFLKASFSSFFFPRVFCLSFLKS